jgi:hypothetical protein
MHPINVPQYNFTKHFPLHHFEATRDFTFFKEINDPIIFPASSWNPTWKGRKI